MRMAYLPAYTFLALVLFVGPSVATPEDYCAAYAVDFANVGPDDQAIWQERFDNASKDCLIQYTTPKSPPKLEAKVNTKLKVKPVAVAVKIKKPAKVVAVRKVLAKPIVTPVAIKSKDVKKVAAAEVKIVSEVKKPAPGTPAWIEYCTRKYVSFDAAKGTYLSKTGLARKCLITADFK